MSAREPWYGIVGKPWEPDHLIAGNAPATMCGLAREEMTISARGMFTLAQAAESKGNERGVCAKCILAAARVREPRTNLAAQEATVDALWSFAKDVARLARADAALLTTYKHGGTVSSSAFLEAVALAMTRVADAHGYKLVELQ